MSPDQVDALITALTVFTLAILVGFAVISKVPATLHTPLMSGANSIHGIVLVGAMLIAAEARGGISQALSLIAVAFATMNVVGGYVVTDRMLQMFKKRPAAPRPAESAGPTESTGPAESAGPADSAGPDQSGASA
jgi:NAD(P) transhydrogenase subunit alpha